MSRKTNNPIQHAKAAFKRHRGLLRATGALELGIHPRTLYSMHKSGQLLRLGRGLYRLADLPQLGNPDLVSVALRVPKGVICLISALAFHELTTQIPHEIYIALPQRAKLPKLGSPPVRVFWYIRPAYGAGIERHKLDGVPVRIYSPEKTIADCFKYRNKIGLDTALEALRLYRERGPVRVSEVMKYAAVCRVQKVMRPYLEALL
jgi:predicted transcriptional regulator of viral defense system